MNFNNDSSTQIITSLTPSGTYNKMIYNSDLLSTSNTLKGFIDLKQDLLTASTNLLGIGSAITQLDYNKITLNKPTNFQCDYNSTLINKPSTFPADMTNIYTKTQTDTLLNAKEAVLTFSSPLTRTTNTIGINLSSYSTTGTDTNYLLKSGGTMTGSLNITSATTNLNFGSRIQDNLILLYGTDYGIGINASILRFNAPTSASHKFYINNVNIATIDATGFTGAGGGITGINYNNITVNKPTNFQCDYNSTLINKPSVFPPDTTNLYTKTQTDTLLNAKQATLTFSSPLTNTTNTISFSESAITTMTNFYNKTFIDTNIYTKTQTDTLLNAKQATLTFSSPLVNTTNTISFSESAITTMTNFYNKTQIDTSLSAKEAVLTFSSPLTRTTNTISINLSSYSTTGTDPNYLLKTGGTLTGTLSGTIINASTNLQENGNNLSTLYFSKSGGAINGNIALNSGSVGAPAKGVYGNGVGDRIILYQGTSTTYPASIGINTNSFWVSVNAGFSYDFYIDGVDKFKIDSAGNVGIGTITANTKLDVNGVININPANGLNTPQAANYGGSGDRIILWNSGAGLYPYSLGMNANTLWYSVPSGASHKWYNNGTNTMTLDSVGYNKLTINGDLSMSSPNIANGLAVAESRIIAQGGTLTSVFAGDTLLNSYWGIAMNINAGGAGDAPDAGYTKISQTSSFTINTRSGNTSTGFDKTLFALRNSGKILHTAGDNSIIKFGANTNGYYLNVGSTSSASTTMYDATSCGVWTSSAGALHLNPSTANNIVYINFFNTSAFLSVGGAIPQAKLHVASGSITSTLITSARYFNATTAITAGAYTATDVCAIFDSSIWSKSTIISSSDSRIKKNINDIDDDTALQKILSVQPKTYNYIDNIARGDNTVYGFIAQQIQEVIPEAVSIQKEVIPNIYSVCNCSSNIITIPNNALKANDYIDIIDIDGNRKQYNVISVSNDEIIIDSNLTGNECFVYGSKVDDFHILNKDYIFTLNVCATQDLYKLIQQQQEQINLLQKQIQILENKINL